MTRMSLLRLHALRAGYLLLVVGLGLTVWPGIIHHDHRWTLPVGVVRCMLGALSLLSVLGLRYPLKMLPLLLFELAWKTIWLIVVARPAWSSGHMDAGTWETTKECLMAVIFVVIIPWPYVVTTYLTARGDRWWIAGGQSAPPLPPAASSPVRGA